MKVSSLLRKESPCATIIKCIGASSHSEKEVSEWVKVYEAKNAVRVSTKERTDYITHVLQTKQENDMRNISRQFPRRAT